MSSETAVVLWNEKETDAKCAEFVADYAAMRRKLCDHYEHKGHVAKRYEDSWTGFMAYCRERLRLELSEQTVRLQISAAQVSREVGVDVPMVIGRHLAKLPKDKQKEIYDEVIGAREKAGQRSANEMEPDVRKVVRREMGIVEKPAPISPTDEFTDQATPETGLIGAGTPATYAEAQAATAEDFGLIPAQEAHSEGRLAALPASLYAQEPRTEDLEPEEVNDPPEEVPAPSVAYRAYVAARRVLRDWCAAYDRADKEGQLAARMNARIVISEFSELL